MAGDSRIYLGPRVDAGLPYFHSPTHLPQPGLVNDACLQPAKRRRRLI
jgi:hypothetical protein